MADWQSTALALPMTWCVSVSVAPNAVPVTLSDADAHAALLGLCERAWLWLLAMLPYESPWRPTTGCCPCPSLACPSPTQCSNPLRHAACQQRAAPAMCHVQQPAVAAGEGIEAGASCAVAPHMPS
jgi:hypothetical protein